jgi:LPXTG-motif cell wall-anchored protein
MLARRLLIASGMAVASMSLVSVAPGIAGAVSFSPQSMACSSTVTTNCITPPTKPTKPGTVSATTGNLPYTASPTPGVTSPTAATTSSLPFTGADVEELAVVGLGAVLAGGLLMRRRRRTA